MDAFFARNRLSALIDGDLSPDEEGELRAAVAADPALAAELAALEAAIEALRAAGPARAPAGFEARVMAEVHEAAGTGGVLVRLRALTQRLPVEALALAAAAAVVVVVIQGRPEDSGERAAPVAAAAAPQAPAEVAPAEPSAPEAPVAAAAPPAPRPDPRAAGSVEGAPAAGRRAPGGARDADPGAGAYVPAWDQEEAAAGAAAASGPADEPAPTGAVVGLRLLVTDPSVPLHLVNLCEGAGGMALDAGGRQTRGAALTEEENFTTLQLVVPAAQGPDFARKLKALGARQSGSAAGAVGVDQAGFRVEIVYNP